MKFTSFLLVGVCLSLTSLGQTQVMDTVYVLSANISIQKTEGETNYFINGEPAAKAEYLKILKGYNAKKVCQPCHLVAMDLDSTLVSEGTYFYQWKGPQSYSGIFQFRNHKSVSYSSHSCPHGLWKFYNKKGKLSKSKYFYYGDKVSRRKFLKLTE